MWFRALMGFTERGPADVRRRIEVHGDRMTSKATGENYGCGRLELPSLAELRRRAAPPDGRPNRLREQVADVQQLHRDPALAGAVFQAASQFNLLEMTGPQVTPERGVGIYIDDRTQGPACAIACGAGTIYRNYFVPVPGPPGEPPQIGQTADRQLDCLADIGAALGNDGERLWRMRNGYALLTALGLRKVGPMIGALSPEARDALGAKLRIGLHHDVEVTLKGGGHRVTQVYGSALPVAYGEGATAEWEALARLVLDASYEATLLAAAETPARRVFLTLLGGGVFGNPADWITGAIERALDRVGPRGLEVAIVSYGRSNPAVRALVQGWARPFR